MPRLKIFFPWLLTVVIGSILLPFGVLIWNGTGMVSSDIGFGLFFVLVAIVISGLCSLPTLVALYIVNDVNSRKPLKVRLKYVNMTHLIMFLVTLGGGNLWLYLDSADVYNSSEFGMEIMQEEMLYLSSVILLYAIVAVPIWSLFFRKLWIESREEIPEEPAERQA